MKLILENIGMFERAELKIEGITIIAGKNDSGKSTIGKVLFSLIKADNKARFEFKTHRILRFRSVINNIMGYLKLQRRLSSKDEKNLRLLEKKIASFLKRRAPRYDREREREELMSKLKDAVGLQEDNQIKFFLREMEEILDDNRAFLSSRKRELERQFDFNFEGDILRDGSDWGRIILEDLYEVRIKQNNVIEFKDSLPKDSFGRRIRPLKDATLIESPVVMTLIPFFSSLNLLPDEYRKGIRYPNMIRDVVRKLLHDRQMGDFNNSKIHSILAFIEEIILGKFSVDEDKIFFLKKGKRRFGMVNVAMGVKSFGIIYLLLKHGYIKDFSTLLIVDEPEVHLHPEWHLAYAELLVKIHTELGSLIVINTHSPFFFQAIKKYAFEYDCLEKANFYFAKRKDTFSSELLLINDNLTIALDSLTKPIEEAFS